MGTEKVLGAAASTGGADSTLSKKPHPPAAPLPPGGSPAAAPTPTASNATPSLALASTTPSGRDPKTSLKFEVCIDTLMAGCVNAYVQLFELSHRPPVCVDALAGKLFSVPDDALPWVQRALINVEQHRRRSNFRESFQESLALAKYFEDAKDTEQALVHHKAALQHASESLDRALEGEGHEAIGLLYERLGRPGDAVPHHEARLRLAEIVGEPAAKQRASKHLMRVFMQRGEDAVARGELETARGLFEKSVATARAVGDAPAEAAAYSALGNVTVLLGDLQRALEYQQRFMFVAQEARDAPAQARAHREVARLHERLGETPKAVEHLKLSLDLAEENSDLPAIFDGCSRLGEVYAKVEQPRRAVHYFQQAFKVARDIGDPALIERSRVALGFSLGEHNCAHGDQGFLGVCCNDLAALLQWMETGTM